MSIVKNYDKILSNIKPHQILDTLIVDKKIYFSFVTKNDNCYRFNIYFSEINRKELNFKNFLHLLNAWAQLFKEEECKNILI